jgi:hypothetical protein
MWFCCFEHILPIILYTMYAYLLKKYDNPQFLNLQWFGESCVWCSVHGVVIRTINPNWVCDL